MRRIIVATGLALALAIGLLAQSQAAAPSLGQRPQAAAAPTGADQPVFAVPTNDNWSTLTYNHFGDPSKGQVVIEQWVRVFWQAGGAPNDPDLPEALDGRGRVILLPGAKRVAFRVRLYEIGKGLVHQTDVVNTAGARMLVIDTVGVHDLANRDVTNCAFWTDVVYSIRWNDNTLTQFRVFTSPSYYWNDNCYLRTP
jgi:hypothetical protein